MSKPQLDLFATQDDLFPAQPVSYGADPERVRRRLASILAEVRDADTMPWDHARQRLYRTIVPQMTLWLPEDEAAQLRFDFESEMRRLEAA
jgi:hypothetical protein